MQLVATPAGAFPHCTPSHLSPPNGVTILCLCAGLHRLFTSGFRGGREPGLPRPLV